MSLRRPHRAVSGFVALAAAGTLAMTFWACVGSPLRFDEVEFVEFALGIVRHGTPRLLLKEDPHVYQPPHPAQDAKWIYGMWHPPLYQHTLAAFGGTFGFRDSVLRSVGLVWFLATICLVALTCRQLDSADPTLCAGLACALIFLCPLLAEGSLYVDIDNTCLTTLLLLFVVGYLRDPDADGWGRTTMLGVLFGASLWAKLTTPFMLIPAVAAFQLLRGRYRLGVLQPAVILVIGVGLFVISFGLYCWLLDYPWKMMFDFTFVQKKSRIAGGASFLAIAQSLRWNLVWVSPALVLMFAVTVGLRVRHYWTTRRAEKVDFLVLFALIGYAAYICYAATIGKYTYPPTIIAIVAVAWQLVQAAREVRVGRWSAIGAAFAVAVGVQLAISPLVAKPPLSWLPGQGFRVALADPRNIDLIVSLVGLAACIGLTSAGLFGPRAVAGSLYGSLVFALAAGPIAAAKCTAISDERAPYRPFCESGFRETVAFLNEHTTPHEVIVAPKDIGHYFHGRTHDTSWALIHGDVPRLVDLVTSPDIRYFVDSTDYPAVPLDRAEEVVRYLELVGRFESFVVYRNPRARSPLN